MSYPQTIRIMCQSGETCLTHNQDNVSRVERHVLPTDNQDNVSEWRDMSYPQSG
jgi:ribosomal protein L44E